MCRRIGGKSVMVKLNNVTEEVLNVLTIMNLAKAVPSILEKMAYPFVMETVNILRLEKRRHPGINIYIDGKTNGESV